MRVSYGRSRGLLVDGDAGSEGGHSLSWLLLAAAGTEDLRRSHGGLDWYSGGSVEEMWWSWVRDT